MPEDGESLNGALIREVHEELGLDLADLRSAFTCAGAGPRPARWHSAEYALLLRGAFRDPQPAREIAELALFGLAHVHRAAAAVKKVLRQLIARHQ
jgi:ADP-ribose pyrophosphatase YjhB (NUDIX family)